MVKDEDYWYLIGRINDEHDFIIETKQELIAADSNIWNYAINIAERVDALEAENIGNIRSRVDDIRSRVDELELITNDIRTQQESIIDRITALEQRPIPEIPEAVDISGLQRDIDDLKRRVGGHDVEIKGALNRISRIEKELGIRPPEVSPPISPAPGVRGPRTVGQDNINPAERTVYR